MTKDRDEQQEVLEVIQTPRTRIEIAELTKLPIKSVSKIIRQLEKQGLVITRGRTSARRHMSLVAAINELYDKIGSMA